MSSARYKVPTIEDIASTEAGRSALVKHAKGEPMSQHEVGAMLGISHAHVSTIERRALAKLRDAILGIEHKDDTQTIKDARVERAERIAAERKRRQDASIKPIPVVARKETRPPDKRATMIFTLACEAIGERPGDLSYSDRRQTTVVKRNRVWWIMRALRDTNGPISFKRIGRATGGHDHTSVMHGICMHTPSDFDRRTIKRLQRFIDDGGHA